MIQTTADKKKPQIKTYFFHKNHENSVTAITDENGKTVEEYRYDAFGKPYIRKNKNGDWKKWKEFSEAKSGNTRLFTGREYDSEVDLYYYRARFYDPISGRFLSGDPVGTRDQVNLYTYVNNNPVGWVDPTGREKNMINMTSALLDLLNSSKTTLQESTFTKYTYMQNTLHWWAWNVKELPQWQSAAIDGKILIGKTAVSLSDLWNFLVGYNGYYADIPLNWSNTKLDMVSFIVGESFDSIYDIGMNIEIKNYTAANPNLSMENIQKRALADELPDRGWYSAGYLYAIGENIDGISPMFIENAIKVWNKMSTDAQIQSNILIDEACWDSQTCRMPH